MHAISFLKAWFTVQQSVRIFCTFFELYFTLSHSCEAVNVIAQFRYLMGLSSLFLTLTFLVDMIFVSQMSGAKVKLHNSEQGAKDRVLELSGTQEQTHAAQSLVQAYMQSMGGGGLLSSSGFAA